jgi:hypothetical protein
MEANMQNNKLPFFGVYETKDGNFIDMATGAAVTPAQVRQRNRTPFYGVFIDINGNEHELSGMSGVDGFTPYITVKTSTDTEYILTITNKDGAFDTPNLMGGRQPPLPDVGNVLVTSDGFGLVTTDGYILVTTGVA